MSIKHLNTSIIIGIFLENGSVLLSFALQGARPFTNMKGDTEQKACWINFSLMFLAVWGQGGVSDFLFTF